METGEGEHEVKKIAVATIIVAIAVAALVWKFGKAMEPRDYRDDY